MVRGKVPSVSRAALRAELQVTARLGRGPGERVNRHVTKGAGTRAPTYPQQIHSAASVQLPIEEQHVHGTAHFDPCLPRC